MIVEKIWMKPTGRLVKGHVMDVNPKHFQRALQDYDKFLYVTWNPNKLKGWGCWEIRRRPEYKSVVDRVEFQGVTYTRIEYKEYRDIHHVLDCAFLNYDAIRKLKEMDTWQDSHWIHHEQYLRDKLDDKTIDDATRELKYSLRYNKSAIKDFMELVRSGKNPAQVLSGVKWVYKNQ